MPKPALNGTTESATKVAPASRTPISEVYLAGQPAAPAATTTTLSAARAAKLEEAVKRSVTEAVAALGFPVVDKAPEPLTSRSSDDQIRAAGGAYTDRARAMFAGHLEGKLPTTEAAPRGPGDPYNSRAWLSLGEILQAEAQQKAASA